MDDPILMSAAAYDGYDLCGKPASNSKKGLTFTTTVVRIVGDFDMSPEAFV